MDASLSTPRSNGITKSNSTRSSGTQSTKSHESKSNGITKSNSTKSAGTQSTKSHESVSVIGPYPLGSLRLVRSNSLPRTAGEHGVDQDDDMGTPPLDPPLDGGSRLMRGRPRLSRPGRQTSIAGPIKRTRGAQAHSMGGGDVALIVDLPDVLTVGYDALCFTAYHFAGVRDIPDGPHFLWVGHPSGVAARAGVWLFASPTRHRVHVVQWDKYNEDLTEALSSEARNHASNIPNIHPKLIPYSDPSRVGGAVGQLSASKIEANLAVWTQLTTCVTPSLLDRITGPQTRGWIVHTLDRAAGVLQFSLGTQLDRAMANRNLQQRQLKFMFDRATRMFSLESYGSERSLEAIDPTKYLLSQIENPDNDLVHDDLVGELQFSFIVGILLGNDACLDQWWFMVLKLLVKCHVLVEKQPLVVASMWRTLTAQVTYGTHWMETTMLDPSEHRCQDLRISLIVYKRRLREFLKSKKKRITNDHLAVGTTFARLESVLAGLGWDLDADYVRKGILVLDDGEEVELELEELEAEDERGEWAPQIIELDAEGRQFGLVSWD